MVLISIHPFAFRKIFLLAALLLGLSSALCLADSLFMTRYYVPSEHRAGIPKSAGPTGEQTRSKPVSPLFEKLDGENSHADFEPILARPVPANGFSATDNYPTAPSSVCVFMRMDVFAVPRPSRSAQPPFAMPETVFFSFR